VQTSCISITWPFNSPYAISYWWSFGTESLSVMVFEIDYLRARLSGTRPWPFRITWRHRTRYHLIPRMSFLIGCSDLTESVGLYPAVFEIMRPKYIGVTTLTFHGHVMSSITWPFDSLYAISCSLEQSLHLQPFSRYTDVNERIH